MKRSSLVTSCLLAWFSATLSAQSVTLHSASFPADGSPGLDCDVSVTLPAGTTGTMKFELLRGTPPVVVGSTSDEGVSSEPNQEFRVLFFHSVPQSGDVVRVTVTCSNGTTVTSTYTIP
jgi:hypothetical protein